MRVVLAALFFLISSSLANAANWPAADQYLATLVDCADTKDKDVCAYNRQVWPKEYADAIAGKYQGQRNVSFCLSTGCDGAVTKNPMLGCAWRIVIIASGHLELDGSDTSNLKYFCGHELVDGETKLAAEEQAKRILFMMGN